MARLKRLKVDGQASEGARGSIGNQRLALLGWMDGREAGLAFMAKYPRPKTREEDEAFARR